MIAPGVEDLVERAQELNAEDEVVLRVYFEHHRVFRVGGEEALKWDQVVRVVDLDLDWAEFVLVCLVALEDLVLAGRVATRAGWQVATDHIVKRDPIIVGHQNHGRPCVHKDGAVGRGEFLISETNAIKFELPVEATGNAMGHDLVTGRVHPLALPFVVTESQKAFINCIGRLKHSKVGLID